MSRSKENLIFIGGLLVIIFLLGKPSILLNGPILDGPIDCIGLGIMLLGLLIRTTARDWKITHGVDCLVTSGPYGIIRNPMYLGSFLMGWGVALILGSIYFLIAYTIFFLVIHEMIIHREEKFLRSIYKDEYEKYLRLTQRLCPSPIGFIRLIAHTFCWIASIPYAFIRERDALWGGLMAALIAEIVSDSLMKHSFEIHSEQEIELYILFGIFILWILSAILYRKLRESKAISK